MWSSSLLLLTRDQKYNLLHRRINLYRVQQLLIQINQRIIGFSKRCGNTILGSLFRNKFHTLKSINLWSDVTIKW